MRYNEFEPTPALKKYIKCHYIIETDVPYFADHAFATGCMEIMFNMGSGSWQVNQNGGFTTTPPIELWGQIIQPMPFRVAGKGNMLGVRFLPQGAFVFLNENLSALNNRITDYRALAGPAIEQLHQQLLETPLLSHRIALVEKYLLKKLDAFEKKRHHLPVIQSVITDLASSDHDEGMHRIAGRYGFTSRYLQKLFLQHTGLTPKLYQKIDRFQKSLVLIGKGTHSLTSIAYECGYFDQSHFNRDFRFFTGINPSAYQPANTTALLASPNK